ncbi:ABC transporter ATP-binding protein [Jatrophihabitans fulvus]
MIARRPRASEARPAAGRGRSRGTGRGVAWPTPGPDEPVVHLRSVHKTFDVATAPVRALRGVDLDVRRGEFVAVVGASGSGKSTLLSVIAGLEVVDDGTATVAGLDLAAASPAQRSQLRREHVAIVFQFFRLLEQMTAQQNIAFAAQVAGVRTRAANERAADLLDQLGLLARARDYPMTMSGGERQRLAIARAMAAEPTVLLADEPTGSLDSGGAAEIVELLSRLHAEGQTILLVTHDDSVAAAADRVVVLRDGSVVGSPHPGGGEVRSPAAAMPTSGPQAPS